MKHFIRLFLLLGFLTACQYANHESSPATHEDHEEEALPIHVFADGMEIFAESGQLVAGEEVAMRAHLTILENYAPVASGTLSFRLRQSGSEGSWQELDFLKAGIFTGSFVVPKAGICQMEFKYSDLDQEHVFIKDSLRIVSLKEELLAEEHQEGLPFLLEQAWETEFGIQRIENQTFSQALNCGGAIIASPESTYELSSPVSGQIQIERNDLVIGAYITRGTLLFTVKGSGFGNENLDVLAHTAKAVYDNSKTILERKSQLRALEAVSQKELEQARADFEIAKSQYEALTDHLAGQGVQIKSPVSGYLTELNTTANGFVERGFLLGKIVRQGELLIQANLPVSKAKDANNVHSLYFKQMGDPAIHTLEEQNGSLISIGNFVNPLTGMIPILFKVDGQGLTPGSFAELWLLTNPTEDQIVVPKSSLIEEYGLFYVYVQIGGESYEKRAVKIAATNGRDYLIESGLEIGEVIVSKGAMAIKIANAMGTPPAHVH